MLQELQVRFDHPLFLITYPYITHCMGACSAKGEWSLFSLYLSLIFLSPLYTVLPILHRARLFLRRLWDNCSSETLAMLQELQVRRLFRTRSDHSGPV